MGFRVIAQDNMQPVELPRGKPWSVKPMAAHIAGYAHDLQRRPARSYAFHDAARESAEIDLDIHADQYADAGIPALIDGILIDIAASRRPAIGSDFHIINLDLSAMPQNPAAPALLDNGTDDHQVRTPRAGLLDLRPADAFRKNDQVRRWRFDLPRIQNAGDSQ